MKKWTCWALALLLVVGMLPTAALALEGPMTARFIYHPLIEQMAKEGIDYNDNRIWNFHKEHSGIDVKITSALVDFAQEKQKKAMILASGDVPDLMVVDQTEYFQYAIEGVLLPTDKYLETMPNYMGLVPDAAREACRVEGVLYGFPGSHEESEMLGCGGMLVRKDVYDTLGLEKEPQTLEEYYQMFKLVKEKTGMIPMVHKSLNAFAAAFGVASQTKEKDGKLVFTWAQPEFKEYLTYLSKLYTEGLLDKEYVTSNTASLQEKFLNGQAFCANLGWADPCVTVNGVLKKIEGAQLAYLTQPTKDETTPTELPLNFPVQRFNVIPAMAKNPDLAAKFIEYMCSPEAKRVQDSGIEGVDYTMVDGKVQQTLEEQNKVGWKIVYEYIPTPESFQNRLFMKGFDWAFTGLMEKRAESNVLPVADALTFLPPSESYLDLQQQLGLKAYSDEQADKFIMGERPMEDFDKYLAELEQRGLSKLETALNEWAASVK